ncbi:hypothetical protein PV10_00105 [Exophiala mesophila]|uniref:Uncharacterized protein n=1 Tax=Exophiala mesophila TaxID=212818 RepID=A0A0D1ZQF6_EXOME|nr:uncharacterized protein PV10_00105 [Exophiala mesophila]KIV96214.1 hypothetical protein PV10_00105 [Exophiala mesophila]
MDPDVLPQKGRFQITYELPHQAYHSCVYPQRSSNGSRIIVYGHDRGLRVVWYGGRSFASPKPESAPKTNGTSKSTPMVIDLEDEDTHNETPATPHQTVGPTEFQQNDDEIDHSAPYQRVLRFMDLPLGTAALRIAIPHIHTDISQAAPDSYPLIYRDRIIVAAACADLSIRIVTLPLTPPHPDVRDVSTLEVESLKIFGPNSHQDFISDIAITQSTGAEADETEIDDQVRPNTRARSQAARAEDGNSTLQKWSLLVASVSSTGSGLLLVHQLPLISQRKLSTKPQHFLPIRRQYLRSPAAGARLTFNPAVFPSQRHSSLLLTLPAASLVKLYHVFATHVRDRRGSTATADSMSSRDSLHASDGGSFPLTFLPPFETSDIASGVPRRKRVIDAQWIAAGRAIIGLLEDGEWGIWDLEAVGPRSTTSGMNLIRGQSNISGIQGGSLTRFAVRSHVNLPNVAKQSSTVAFQPSSGSLAPMTPATRKERSDGLFRGKATEATIPSSPQRNHGSISVDRQSLSVNGRSQDESVTISFADQSLYIPSILSLWKGDTQPVRMPNLKLGGQNQQCIHVLPCSTPGSSLGLLGITDSIPEFMVQTSHRLILSVHPLSDPLHENTNGSMTTIPHTSDQALLDSGELDVDGMDRILDNMDTNIGGKRHGSFNKNAHFREDDTSDDDDDDDDTSMVLGSPTPAKFTASRNMPFSRLAGRQGPSSKYAGGVAQDGVGHGRSRPSQPTQRRIFT